MKLDRSRDDLYQGIEGHEPYSDVDTWDLVDTNIESTITMSRKK